MPEEQKDGLYLLNLQIPSFVLDAGPSKPVLFPLDPRFHESRSLIRASVLSRSTSCGRMRIRLCGDMLKNTRRRCGGWIRTSFTIFWPSTWMLCLSVANMRCFCPGWMKGSAMTVDRPVYGRRERRVPVSPLCLFRKAAACYHLGKEEQCVHILRERVAPTWIRTMPLSGPVPRPMCEQINAGKRRAKPSGRLSIGLFSSVRCWSW